MNDRHPSGTVTSPAPASDAAPAPYASYGGQDAQYGDFTTYGGHDGYDAAAYATDTYDTSAAYDASAWTTGAHQPTAYQDPYAAQQAGYDSGGYDATAWTAEYGYAPQASIPQQGTAPEVSGQWDASGWQQPDPTGTPADRTQQWEWGTQTFETGTYDATQWDIRYQDPAASDDRQADTTDHADTAALDQAGGQQAAVPFDQLETATFKAFDDGSRTVPAARGELPAEAPPLLEGQEEYVPRPASRGAARSRRRAPAKRSALLTVAVPSVCVMGVAGVAAASVGTLTGGEKDTSASASDAQSVKPSVANDKLDTQLRSLSAGADDFADRASRTQERIDLRAEQATEKKKAAEEAARKERLRPKFAIPVAQLGLSAYFGQAGVNWMSVHTGIDFPVSYGTTVMAATDGVVTTKWNSAYGNMMIVTAKDGTETWYCHLSTYRVASGTSVKAGDPIAYSGNSGNSTGPHLHFEVRPAGGSPIDPLPWLRSHGLDPT
ncbi:M23 family metallopeptidase [Streptomyces sp. NPDC047000]|uniref:M23 family metallopeptidase n=1 Tax=Streptomyces sp. NPDC047000 TaxID=3155474 RepID=UPI0033DD0915